MRVISLHQPFATLLVLGEKIFETRHWATLFRGNLAIHAAKTTQYKTICDTQPFQSVLSKNGYHSFSLLPRGGVIGKVNLLNCLKTSDTEVRDKLKELANEKFFGNFANGRFAWKTAGQVKFDKMIECVGRQGFFNVDDELIKNAILF